MKSLKGYQIVVILILLVNNVSIAQVTDYLNFHLNGNLLTWQKVYERDSMTVDQISEIINDVMKADPTMNLVASTEEEMTFDMKEKIFSRRGDLYSGRVTIGLKEGKYRVVISGIRRFLGEKSKSAMTFWVGSEFSSSYSGGITIEDDYLNKKHTSIKLGYADGMSNLNNLFEKAFQFNEVKEIASDDW